MNVRQAYIPHQEVSRSGPVFHLRKAGVLRAFESMRSEGGDAILSEVGNKRMLSFS